MDWYHQVLLLKKSPAFVPVTEDFSLKWNHVLNDSRKTLTELLLYESQEVIAKIEFDTNSELENLNIDIAQKWKEFYTRHKNYEKVLESRITKKWCKIEEKEKQNIIPVLVESLGNSSVDKSL